MKKTLIKNFSVAIIMTMILGVTNVLASEQIQEFETETNFVIMPRFIAITYRENSLSEPTSAGKLTCKGITEVQGGYKAGITMELQQNKGSWKTIETWTGSDNERIALNETHYVEKGYSYRLKITHTSSSGSTILETTTTTSATVSY